MFIEPLDSPTVAPEDSTAPGTTAHRIQIALLALAYGLAGIGTLIVLSVLTTIYATFQDFGANKFIQTLAHDIAAQPWVLSSDASFSIQVSEAPAKLIAVLVYLLYLGLQVMIGNILIRAGVHVVTPKFDYELMRLRQRGTEVAKRAEALVPFRKAEKA